MITWAASLSRLTSPEKEDTALGMLLTHSAMFLESGSVRS